MTARKARKGTAEAATMEAEAPQRYAGMMAQAGIMGSPYEYITAAALQNAVAFDILDAGNRMGTDTKGQPQPECYYDVRVVGGQTGIEETRRLTLAETETRAKVMKFVQAVRNAGGTAVGPMILTRWSPEPDEAGYWVFREVDPAGLTQYGYKAPSLPAKLAKAAPPPNDEAEPDDDDDDLPF